MNDEGKRWVEGLGPHKLMGPYGTVLGKITDRNEYGALGVKLIDQVHGDVSYAQLDRNNEVILIQSSDTHDLQSAQEDTPGFLDTSARFGAALDRLIADLET